MRRCSANSNNSQTGGLSALGGFEPCLWSHLVPPAIELPLDLLTLFISVLTFTANFPVPAEISGSMNFGVRPRHGINALNGMNGLHSFMIECNGEMKRASKR